MSSKNAPSLVINCTPKPPVGVVYQAWPDPTKIIKWFGHSDEIKCETPDFDVHVGRCYKLLLLSPTDRRSCVSGEYKEIIENKALALSWAYKTTPASVSLGHSQISS